MFATYFPYKWQFLLAVIGFYLFLGTFMDAIPAMILFVPVLMPVATAFGITPVQLGLIIVITLAVGQVTPPVGVNLFVAIGIKLRDGIRVTLQEISRAVVPMVAASIVVLLIITYIPQISTCRRHWEVRQPLKMARQPEATAEPPRQTMTISTRSAITAIWIGRI
jgi:TRAP-type C4-dicarboxylate transport system permease large subunit